MIFVDNDIHESLACRVDPDSMNLLLQVDEV